MKRSHLFIDISLMIHASQYTYIFLYGGLSSVTDPIMILFGY